LGSRGLRGRLGRPDMWRALPESQGSAWALGFLEGYVLADAASPQQCIKVLDEESGIATKDILSASPAQIARVMTCLFADTANANLQVNEIVRAALYRINGRDEQGLLRPLRAGEARQEAD
jgi:hypothetical protein